MYYFIVNPASHSSGRNDVWRRIRAELKRRNIPFRAFRTDHEGHAAELAGRISSRAPGSVIVTVGGDGSVHEVLNGISDPSSVTLGVIPRGSGNDFARGLGIPADPLAALDTVLAGKTTAMDLGWEESPGQPRKRFGVSCGIGFDASICHEALHSPIKDTLNAVGLGSATYGVIAVKQILTYRKGPMYISADGGEAVRYDNVFFACVMNEKYEGGGFMMTPDASPCDGILNVFICCGISNLRLVTALPLTRKGKHTRVPGIHFLKGKTISIRSGRSVPIHLDGESGGVHEILNAGIENKKLKVLVP